jgi:hypothetical protein
VSAATRNNTSVVALPSGLAGFYSRTGLGTPLVRHAG